VAGGACATLNAGDIPNITKPHKERRIRFFMATPAQPSLIIGGAISNLKFETPNPKFPI
jgi:hypothetical protein